MSKLEFSMLAAVAGCLLSACSPNSLDPATSTELAGKADVPAVSFTPGGESGDSAKPRGPVSISYKIIGKPIVGQTLAIDLRIYSAIKNESLSIAYRIADATALQLGDAQPEFVTVSSPADAPDIRQQVTIVPLRQGRLFLNVEVTAQTADGPLATVTAIPVQVGAATQKPREQGSVEIDSEGNRIRVMKGSDG